MRSVQSGGFRLEWDRNGLGWVDGRKAGAALPHSQRGVAGLSAHGLGWTKKVAEMSRFPALVIRRARDVRRLIRSPRSYMGGKELSIETARESLIDLRPHLTIP